MEKGKVEGGAAVCDERLREGRGGGRRGGRGVSPSYSSQNVSRSEIRTNSEVNEITSLGVFNS